MSILIADSGSTKTEWIFKESESENRLFYSEGLNPYFTDQTELTGIIEESVAAELNEKNVEKIFFYGAGCGTEQGKAHVRTALATCFEGANISVESDLLGAAIACFGKEPGVACILGTGSNSCFYDGSKISDQIPSLGFTLGDEGSGGYFGKKILRSYFYGTMPEDLRSVLKDSGDMALATVLEHVYQKPNANRYVASFSRLLGDHSDHPFILDMVKEGFIDFAEKQLGYFGDLTGKSIGFVGSIAFVYQDILKGILTEKGMKAKVFIRKPIEALADFHQPG